VLVYLSDWLCKHYNATMVIVTPLLSAVTALAVFWLALIQLDVVPNITPSGLLNQLQQCHPGSWFSQDWNTSFSKPGFLNDEYLLGVGRADITGPVVEINFMGYADPKQLGSGVRQRIYARAFIIGSLVNPEERIVYLVLDTQSGDTAVRYGILQGLNELGSDYAVYNVHNIAVTGTHSHSGPGAWLNYLLPQITAKGFDKQSYNAIVNGTLLAIQRAHKSLKPGRLTFGTAEVEDANINRSPYAYLANPEKERQRYQHDVDKNITLLRFQHADQDIGVLTWFPVHGTSMLGNNTLVTGDNKGVAAYLFEESMGDGFVAGFSQSNVGDTSPNVLGAWCEDGSGTQCSFETSVCSNNRSQACHGRGPFFGQNDAGTESCFEIGLRQFNGAADAFHNAQSGGSGSTTISGPVSGFHVFRDFSNLTFPHPNGTMVSTCSAALGYSFAAGTTDGPGAFDFRQNNSGKANANPLWAVVRDFLHTPDERQIQCHGLKPILLDVGQTTSPYLWSPNIVDIQLLRVGQLIIIVAPGEATTMSGRRWKEAIAAAGAKLSLGAGADQEPLVVLGGPANTYTHYIATEEEYSIQRYEGASTLYGPHTLNAYIHLTTTLLPYLDKPTAARSDLDLGPQPPIHVNSSLNFNTGVVYDRAGFFQHFGQVLTDVLPPSKHVYSAREKVVATFVGANPRNDLKLEGTYAQVERLSAEYAAPQAVRTDRDWDLVFEWRRTGGSISATSEVTITWEVPEHVEPGEYRLVYNGDSKAFGSGTISTFSGMSGIFQVR